MQNPLEVTFHDISRKLELVNLIDEKFTKLRSYSPDVTKCHVVVEKLSKHHQTANTAAVRMDLKIPHFEDIVITEKCDESDASLTKATNKIFKRGLRLMRKDLERRQDSHRGSKLGDLPLKEEDDDYEDYV